MRRISIYLAMIALCLGISSPARGQGRIEVVILQLDFTFGEQISIEAEVASELPIKSVQVFLQPETGNPSADGEITFTPPNQILYTLDLSDHPLDVFSQINYWFKIELENGEFITSETFHFDYTDNRFEWQSLSTDEFEIFWYRGGDDFGKQVINTAYDGLARIREYLQVPQSKKVTFYIYASTAEMQETLQITNQVAEQIAGHANSDLGVITASIPPGPSQTLEIKRQIPHELSHVLLYQKLGNGYVNLPKWLNEGLASRAELFPNPNYAILLRRAYEREALLTIAHLCDRFPTDAANFQLAYAQAASFTEFLQGKYGNDKMEALLTAYGDGLECQHVVEQVFNATLMELERDWRQYEFQENLLLATLQEMTPWLVLLGAILTPMVILFFGGRVQRKR